ncbi:ABC transporter permease [Mucilaginibacter sp. BJC16-A38]|uniref:ABC transporter permease n=1 Tax=Mucilaginibacter phenanthrenivorans TaxID=1234842 RepID=UPI00215731A6|nr:ABC transporter permease [Mucilaginibacter phenanthrenivorans]MCR8561415.1 ABC transporter permease [Mucilaginibacter phenanthrenivorans]
MFTNYFKTAWRILWRNKIYTSINVLGLALGICACVVIYLISGYELSFDTFHPDKDRIFRVMTTSHFAAGDQDVMSKVPFSSVAATRRELPGVEAISAVSMYYAKITVPDGNKRVKKFDSSIDGAYYPGTIVAEPQYFKIFSYHWLAGNQETALNQPYKVVLTLSRAQKYFGYVDPGSLLGREIVYDDSLRVQISGIVEDWKKNTDFAFTDFISYSTVQNSFLKKAFADDWNHMSTQAFVKLAPGTSQDKVNAGFAAIVKAYAPKNPDVKLNLWLEPITKVHFDADVVENPIRTADLPIVYGMIGTAVFILLLALVNFVNLATAQSIQRTREMAVRKIMGSSKTGIMLQFLIETFLVTFFALIIALLSVNPVLSVFKAFIPPGVSFRLMETNTLLFISAITLVTCLFAGLYPARTLAAYAPALSLRGTATPGGRHWWLRKGLIVFQFTLSLVFIIGSLVVHQQLSYTRSKAIGFNTDAIVILPTSRKAPAKQMNVLAQQLKQIPGVNMVASEQYTPMDGRDGNIALKLNGINGAETRIPELSGDEHYLSLYGMKLLAGRNLLPADSLKEYVINETFLHLLGLREPQEAIGKMLHYQNKPYPIVGVVADFHEKSFHETIKPVCIVNIPKVQQDLAVKLTVSGEKAAALKTTLAMIERSWKAMYPGEVFDFRFFDESIALLYEKDYRTAKLINAATIIVIFISCIGLFGLTIFTTKRRTAEIGIRKVLGASVSNITLMLSKDFVVLVLAALVVASPVAWYLMDRWLQNFVYRIAISWWMFALSGIVAIFIALLTISFQSIKAAMMNPVKSLRGE